MRPIIGDVPMRRGRGSIPEVSQSHGRTRAHAAPAPLPPAVGRPIERSIGTRTGGPILLNSRGARMDRHAATHARIEHGRDEGVAEHVRVRLQIAECGIG
jgi:hypothetical protein